MNDKSTKEKKAKPLTSVMEDYLEAIFDLEQEKKFVRVKDIAQRLNVRMPTVSSMLDTLSKRALVYYEKRGYVELTESGVVVGREMRRRHEALYSFLTEILHIPHKKANEEACKMEHALSSSTLDSLTDFMEFVRVCPRAGDSWLANFEEFRNQGKRPEKCTQNAEIFSGKYQREIGAMQECLAGNKKNKQTKDS